MLYVKNLVKSYNGYLALKDITAEFREKAINVIIGPSGCGKTTLFNCISGLEGFDSGELVLDNVQVADASTPPTRRRDIGYVLQGYSLFTHLKVIENLTLAPKLVLKKDNAALEQQALALLDKMQLRDKKDTYPNQLSGGQQQRVAIARAIMMSPKVLLLDEPTNALDPQLVLALEKTLKQLVDEGFTLVISTHHLGFAKRMADYSFFMHHGELLASSEKAALLETPELPEIRAFIQKELQDEVNAR